MEKYGIETLKKIALILIKLGMKLESITWNWKSILFSLIPFVLKNFKSITEVWKNKDQIFLEFKDLSSSERIEFNTFISVKLDLHDDQIEKIIEYSVDTLSEISIRIEKIITLIRNGKR